MKTPEQKIAQRFVVLAYLRKRAARKTKKIAFERNLINKYEWAMAENEAHNHLQIAKEIYYSL